MAHFFGPEETSFEVQEVSWLLWTGVFRGAAPVVQAVLPTLMLPNRRASTGRGAWAACFGLPTEQLMRRALPQLNNNLTCGLLSQQRPQQDLVTRC